MGQKKKKDIPDVDLEWRPGANVLVTQTLCSKHHEFPFCCRVVSVSEGHIRIECKERALWWTNEVSTNKLLHLQKKQNILFTEVLHSKLLKRWGHCMMYGDSREAEEKLIVLIILRRVRRTCRSRKCVQDEQTFNKCFPRDDWWSTFSKSLLVSSASFLHSPKASK